MNLTNMGSLYVDRMSIPQQNFRLFDAPGPQTRGILVVLAKKTFRSVLGFGRVIYQSLPLGERKRLVPVSPTKIDSCEIYGFWKYGFGPGVTFQSVLGFGRVIYQSLPLGEKKRLVPVLLTKIDSSEM
ncbi:hypothetical protein Ddc_13313 [Ditylenchus destructor]|nr:hypothetical protein Ddc_13313 [Ditylenchus destructor]